MIELFNGKDLKGWRFRNLPGTASGRSAPPRWTLKTPAS